jgi:uncharacterized phage protein gp47/JayE
METYRLKRHGQPPLTFTGELIASSDGKWFRGQERNRYHDLRLYRTEAGTYVGEVAYETAWQGESDFAAAETGTREYVVDWFRGYNPAEHTQGFPPGEQARLLDDLRARFNAQLSDLFDSDEFAERVQ